MSASLKKKLLVFVVAYNAEKTIDSVLTRIPSSLQNQYEVEVLVIDDASKDHTFERGELVRRSNALPFPLRVLFNTQNQGYGGNQKIGFHYAIAQGFDFVALLHGDGQYAPECLPELIAPLNHNEADAVFGSRMLAKKSARKGGMPLYKFIGNKVLTCIQNLLLGTHLSEFHSGYRLYSVAALKKIPFSKNTNVFHFDTEIIIQLLFARQRIKELPIPTYYGDEICHVNGLKYAWDVIITTLKASVQSWGIFYDRKFDCKPVEDATSRILKIGYKSTHSVALSKIPASSRVLVFGHEGGTIIPELEKRGCTVVSLDPEAFCAVSSPLVTVEKFDYVLALDTIGHLSSPEMFVDNLLRFIGDSTTTQTLVSVGNVAFFPVRFMLLLGQFNYSKRGVLDLSHTRLFTSRSLKELFAQNGFDVVERIGIPAPFCIAVGNNIIGRFMTLCNGWLIHLSTSFFSYQIFFIVRPRPTLDTLLKRAFQSSATRAGTNR